MANGFLTPFLTGAFTEYTRQEIENDKIIGNIIDNVSNQVLNKEIPAEQALLKDALKYKNEYEANYGPEVAGVLDAAGVFNNPTDTGVENALRRFFGTNEYNLDAFKTKVVKYKEDKPDNFDKIIGASFTEQQDIALTNKKDFVKNNFSNTPNIRDLIVSPERKELTGLTGVMFGDRVPKEEVPAATLRLYDTTQQDTSQVVSPLAIKSELGIEVPKEVEPFMTAKLFRDLTKDGQARYDKDIKNPNIKRALETQFGVKKPDPKLKDKKPAEYAAQKKAHDDFKALPAADKENIIRNNFTKDYITNQIKEMVDRGVPGAAQYQTTRTAESIATRALTRIAELQAYEKQTQGPNEIGYSADEDIEAVKAEARKQLTSLGVNPEDYGI